MASRYSKATASSNRTSETFDRLAPSFDSDLQRNPINAWMHDVNMTVLASTFHEGQHLLELGCGTGTAAIALGNLGCTVFGLDISDGMVARAREKVAAEHLGDRITVVTGRSRDLVQLVRRSPWSSFDGAYANFSLTYEEDLAGLANDVARFLGKDAFFIFTLPNRLVLSEVVIYGPQLRFRDFLWRFATPLLMEVDGSDLEMRAFSPWQVREAFQRHFTLRRMIGLPTFLPPVYLHSQFGRLGSARRLLKSLDGRLAGRYPWNRLGEHTLFKFQRI
jgi:SAM-dependent methyltransferase